MLDIFAARVWANAIVHRVARTYEAEIQEANGVIAISAISDPAVAVRFVNEIMAELRTSGFVANVGVCKGEVLLFRFENSVKNLAGSPVNISSKPAEDTTELGKMFFEASVAEAAKTQGALTPFERIASGVSISGLEI